MKTLRRSASLALAALLLAGPVAAALPDAEMVGADGSGVPSSGAEKKPAPRAGAAARKHRPGRSEKRSPREPRVAPSDRSSSLASATASNRPG